MYHFKNGGGRGRGSSISGSIGCSVSGVYSTLFTEIRPPLIN